MHIISDKHCVISFVNPHSSVFNTDIYTFQWLPEDYFRQFQQKWEKGTSMSHSPPNFYIIRHLIYAARDQYRFSIHLVTVDSSVLISITNKMNYIVLLGDISLNWIGLMSLYLFSKYYSLFEKFWGLNDSQTRLHLKKQKGPSLDRDVLTRSCTS